mmetsp:Transcript_7416/g.14076  ORF Transcript_7416/g.14076 Transcript_7416/m.14076 type:complete len:113 (-) Transcript_7416:123-461(-)
MLHVDSNWIGWHSGAAGSLSSSFAGVANIYFPRSHHVCVDTLLHGALDTRVVASRSILCLRSQVAEPIETDNYLNHSHECPDFDTQLQGKRERNESVAVAYLHRNILECNIS